MLDLVQESSPTLTKVFTITFLRPDVPVQKFIAEFKCLLAFSLAFDTKFVSRFVMLARVTNPVMNVVTGIWVTDNRRDSVMITLGDCDLFKEKLGFNRWKKNFNIRVNGALYTDLLLLLLLLLTPEAGPEHMQEPESNKHGRPRTLHIMTTLHSALSILGITAQTYEICEKWKSIKYVNRLSKVQIIKQYVWFHPRHSKRHTARLRK